MNRRLKGVVAVMLVVLSAGLVGFVGDVTKVTDPQIESAIRERLASNCRIDSKNIQVSVDQGVVTLTATVPDWIARIWLKREKLSIMPAS